jgi:hypothetical protein
MAGQEARLGVLCFWEILSGLITGAALTLAVSPG